MCHHVRQDSGDKESWWMFFLGSSRWADDNSRPWRLLPEDVENLLSTGMGGKYAVGPDIMRRSPIKTRNS